MCKPKQEKQVIMFDGTPYDLKGSRTVWSGGKVRDNFKNLPIAISIHRSRRSAFGYDLFEAVLGRRTETLFSTRLQKDHTGKRQPHYCR